MAFHSVNEAFRFPVGPPFGQVLVESLIFSVKKRLVCILSESSALCVGGNDLKKESFPCKVQDDVRANACIQTRTHTLHV